MPRKSIAIIPQLQLEEWKNELISTLSALSKEQLEGFLDEFLTDEEKIMLVKRLHLYRLLSSGVSQKDIQQELGICYETVRIYALMAGQKSSDFKQIIGSSKRTLPQNSKSLNAMKKIGRLIELVGDSKRNTRARAKLYQGDLD